MKYLKSLLNINETNTNRFKYIILIGSLLLNIINCESNMNGQTSKDISNFFSDFSFKGFYESLLTVLLSGFGDKSFFVTTVICFSYNISTVILASFTALTTVGIISICLEKELEKYIPLYIIDIISIALFLIMGVKMMMEGLELEEEKKGKLKKMKRDDVEKESLIEKEKILSENDHDNRITHFIENDLLYNSDYICEIQETTKEEKESIIDVINPKNLKLQFKNKPEIPLMKDFFYEFSQVFTVIFLGELGDRSQISTMYMAGQTTISSLIIAITVGNLLLSILSVIFGKLISEKVSMKTILIYTGGSFVFFGMISLFVCMQEHFFIFDYYKLDNEIELHTS